MLPLPGYSPKFCIQCYGFLFRYQIDPAMSNFRPPVILSTIHRRVHEMRRINYNVSRRLPAPFYNRV